jgi:16S rRNA C967 or C1407 C5-methylase (RsmB/RsmF family)
MALPKEFQERLEAIIPSAQLAEVLASFGADKKVVVWSNPLRDASGAAARALEERGAALEPLVYDVFEDAAEGAVSRAFVVTGVPREAVTRSPEVEAGQLYVINPSSLIPPAVLAPKAGEQVLDLCAAPGGKSVQLAARLFTQGNAGYLAAVESVKPRFFKLQAMLERYGAPRDPARVRLFLKDGRHVGDAVPERFDRVLIDAPCSSEARFDANDEDSMAHWSPRKLEECAYKQRGLLESGLKALKVGGTLVYSTCSLAPEENEQVVLDVLERLGGAVVAEEISFPTGTPSMRGLLGLEAARRVLPDTLWDAFFLVRLRKVGPMGAPHDGLTRPHRRESPRGQVDRKGPRGRR